MMKSPFLAIVISLLLSFSAFSEETEIRVLALITGGADYQHTVDRLDYLDRWWPDHLVSQPYISSVRIVNNGLPFELTGQDYTGTDWDQLEAIIPHPNFGNLREQFAADIVLVFTGPIEDPDEVQCGRAFLLDKNWVEGVNGTPARFIPDANGLDVRGRDFNYIGLVSTAPGCIGNKHTAAHELGHLLGAGHTRLSVTSSHAYLFTDSHARAWEACFDITVMQCFLRQTIMAEGYPPFCASHGMACRVQNFFSRTSPDYNLNALNTTARSVAHYREGTGSTVGGGGGNPGPGPGPGPGPVPCILSAPTNIQGQYVKSCSPIPWTEHIVGWEGSCLQETTKYEVWHSQPDGAPYQKTGETVVPSSPIYVRGADSRIKVRACKKTFNHTVCSALSSSSYLAISDC